MKTFFANQGPFNINQILKTAIHSKKTKFKKVKITNISNLKEAEDDQISFFENKKYLNDLQNTKAKFCFLKKDFIDSLNSTCEPIISTEPLLDFILVAKLFYPDAAKDNYNFKLNAKYKKFLKLNTFVDKSVKIGKNFGIGINSTLKKNIIIGNNVKIGSNCVISNAIIGDNTIINDGSVIGKIGYGFKNIDKKLYFIPHIGCVNIGNNVYIGSNCTIDRGSFSNTEIGSHTMIDNQVHIAHNVKIGTSCFIAGQVGIAGSSTIGNNCMIGGQAGISGHLSIGNNVQIGGNSGVIRSIPDNQKVMGYPAVEFKKFLRGWNK